MALRYRFDPSAISPGVIAVAVVTIAIVAVGLWFLRRRIQRNRTKYGFRLEGESSRLSSANTAKDLFDAFVAENDVSIRDVLSDYARANPSWNEVTYQSGQWMLTLKSGRRNSQDDLVVVCRAGPSYETGQLETAVTFMLPDNLSQKRALQRALERAIRKSGTGRKAVFGVDRNWQ